jgi:molecular chaperone Hsp31 and glyoxalase 3
LDDYAAIFIPGGHGALIGIPESKDVGEVLKWAATSDRFVISLCHGPAGFLAVGENSEIYKGYKICAFPDAIDAKTPDIGYMPGHLTWKFGEKLEALGFEILNDDISGAVHQDRKLLTGDSPMAGNNLGKLAAQAMLKEFSN